MSKKEQKILIRIIVSLTLFVAAFVCDKIIGFDTVIQNPKISWLLPFAIYLVIYFLIGYDVLWRAVKNISRGQVFDENFLMCIATIGAFATKEFPEAVAVLLFYQVGEFFQRFAVDKSRKSISALMDIRPDYANLVKNDGETEEVSPEEVKVGDVILVKAGEKVPLDGVVVQGFSTLDTKALTGESLPKEVAEGDEIISGVVNVTGTLKVRVTKVFYDSTVSKILDLVENAASQKSKSENFISRFAKYYTPIVVLGAVALAVVPSLVTGNWAEWVKRALNFLVVSCPCALVISVPLSFFAGIGGASRNGILIKGSSYLEKLNKANVFVFDKTGTLTKGNFAVTQVCPAENKDKILRLAAIAEQNSNHPIALSIVREYGKQIDDGYSVEDISGKGIKATGQHVILCGNEKLMQQFGIDYVACDGVGTLIYVACDGKFIGSIVVADEIKPDAKETVAYLNSIGAKTVMLTGDNQKIAADVAKKVGVTDFKASLLPQNKVDEVTKLLKAKKSDDVLCFVGDGINDAPVLMKSDIGISMGGVGSDAAIEASDVVLMRDNLTAIKTAKKIAKRTVSVVHQNIWFALLVKAAILVLSAVGLTGMWLAIFADVGVSVLCILNAMRSNFKVK